MNEGTHLDLDTWIVPGQIRKANLCRGLGNRYTPAGTEVLISAVAHNTPPPVQAAMVGGCCPPCLDGSSIQIFILPICFPKYLLNIPEKEYIPGKKRVLSM